MACASSGQLKRSLGAQHAVLVHAAEQSLQLLGTLLHRLLATELTSFAPRGPGQGPLLSLGNQLVLEITDSADCCVKLVAYHNTDVLVSLSCIQPYTARALGVAAVSTCTVGPDTMHEWYLLRSCLSACSRAFMCARRPARAHMQGM